MLLEEIVSEKFAEEWRKESGGRMKFLREERADRRVDRGGWKEREVYFHGKRDRIVWLKIR
ncbi:hypothetical protein C5S31_01590 [ANME-1 cluster archaeon GoMg2]|nr:hypothetical protein [ANME-1 cluster archaeon GoMg2]